MIPALSGAAIANKLTNGAVAQRVAKRVLAQRRQPNRTLGLGRLGHNLRAQNSVRRESESAPTRRRSMFTVKLCTSKKGVAASQALASSRLCKRLCRRFVIAVASEIAPPHLGTPESQNRRSQPEKEGPKSLPSEKDIARVNRIVGETESAQRLCHSATTD
eukprot:3254935-Pleurochrysis_carterae.AAC.1